MPPEVKPTDKPTDEPNNEELSPAEEAKFSKFLNKFLEEDDTPTPTPLNNGPTPTHSAPSLNIADEINKALDAREGRAKDDKWRQGVEGILETLTTPKKKKWYDPFTMFSDK